MIRALSVCGVSADVETLLIAVGGNALYDKATGNNLDQHQLDVVCQRIAGAIKLNFLPVITFGNGPQVGNLLDMAETSARMFKDPVTLDTCVSWTQGEIGYRLQQTLHNHIVKANLPPRTIMAVNTTVAVDPADPAMLAPSKPIGRFISPEEAQQLYEERGWIIGPDANRGYRRLVPSPRPKRIIEAPAIKALVAAGHIVLCGGGGGVPVKIATDDTITGVEAVIDKDFTSCLLAQTLGIDNVLICTEVEHVYLHYGQPQQQALGDVTLSEARQHSADGQFAAGSMGPKVTAMIDFLANGGKRAMITNLDNLERALKGETGTRFINT
jgi:carbamate kinase